MYDDISSDEIREISTNTRWATIEDDPNIINAEISKKLVHSDKSNVKIEDNINDDNTNDMKKLYCK